MAWWEACTQSVYIRQSKLVQTSTWYRSTQMETILPLYWNLAGASLKQKPVSSSIRSSKVSETFGLLRLSTEIWSWPTFFSTSLTSHSLKVLAAETKSCGSDSRIWPRFLFRSKSRTLAFRLFWMAQTPTWVFVERRSTRVLSYWRKRATLSK